MNLESIWSVTGAYVLPNEMDITLDANDNEVCFVGNNKKSYSSKKKIICLDGERCEALWEQESGIPETIEVAHSGVFVAFLSRARVKKPDLKEGNLVWETRLNSGGITYLSYLDDQIQALTAVDDLWILDENGKVVKRISDQRTFLTTPEQTFINLNGIKALDTNSGEVLWEYIDFDLIHAPLFTEDKIFLLNGIGYGTAYALDRSTGKLL
jgi:hypothetical protein